MSNGTNLADATEAVFILTRAFNLGEDQVIDILFDGLSQYFKGKVPKDLEELMWDLKDDLQ